MTTLPYGITVTVDGNLTTYRCPYCSVTTAGYEQSKEMRKSEMIRHVLFIHGKKGKLTS